MAPLPASCFFSWISTLTVSMGWITDVATMPEHEPIKNGFTLSKKSLINILFIIMRHQSTILVTLPTAIVEPPYRKIIRPRVLKFENS